MGTTKDDDDDGDGVATFVVAPVLDDRVVRTKYSDGCRKGHVTAWVEDKCCWYWTINSSRPVVESAGGI